VNSNVNKALKSCSLNNWKSETVLWLIGSEKSEDQLTW
jgi:hypothetical protein